MQNHVTMRDGFWYAMGSMSMVSLQGVCKGFGHQVVFDGLCQNFFAGTRRTHWPFLTGILDELTVRGVEIEPHIVLLQKP